MLAVGAAVRVRDAAPGPGKPGQGQPRQSRRGVIACSPVEESDGTVTVEVLLESDAAFAWRPAADTPDASAGASLEDLEVRVATDRIEALEPFEHADPESPAGRVADAAEDDAELRRRVAALASKGDFRSARLAGYALLHKLAPTSSVGSTVVVLVEAFSERGVFADTGVGMLSTVDGAAGTAEVMTDDGDDVHIRLREAVAVPAQLASALAFAHVALAAARHALQQAPPDAMEAVRLCAVTQRLCKSVLAGESHVDFSSADELGAKRPVLRKLLFSAHMLKSRAHILHGKLTSAAVDIKQAVLLDPSSVPARQLVKAIKQRRLVQEKQNRALARNVTQWVDSAMRESAERESALKATSSSSSSSTSTEGGEATTVGKGVEAEGGGDGRIGGRGEDDDGDGAGIVGWFTSKFSNS